MGKARRPVLVTLIAAIVLCLGCHISNYPLIVDDRGPWATSLVQGQIDKAYIEPTSQWAYIYADGSDELGCPGFTCRDGSSTIPDVYVCDFEPDCDDGSDEEGCAELLCG